MSSNRVVVRLSALAVLLTICVPAALAENESLETLLALLKSPNTDTRRDSARKLGERRVRNQLATEALTVAAREDQSSAVRAEAIKSLGFIKDFSAVPDMLNGLKDQNVDVRLVAVRSLVAMYTEHDIDFITNRRTGWNRLNPFLDTSDHEIVEPYILVDPVIISTIGDSARADRNFDVRVAAVRALGVLRARSAIDQLADALAADLNLRMEVLRAFIKIGDPAAGRFLPPFFTDSDRQVRTQAMVAAGLLKYQPAVEPLMSVYRLGPEEKGMFKKVTDTVKGTFTYLPPRDEAALWALSLIGDPRSESIFAENMNSKDADRRQQAIEGLGRMGNRSYSDRIAEKISSDGHTDVKLARFWATYKLGNTANLVYIVKKLDTDQYEQARGYLMEVNSPADLFPYIRSSSGLTRQRVIDVLGRIGDQDTIKELEPVASGSTSKTADVATLAIKRIEWRIAGRPRAANSVKRSDSAQRASNQK
jgi:HEAT repeat protein